MFSQNTFLFQQGSNRQNALQFMKRRNFIKTLALGSTLLAWKPLYAFKRKKYGNNLSVARYCRESGRDIPVVGSVDIAIVGATTAAIAAAVKASREGARVFLIAPRLYLGEDLCATLRLEISNERQLHTDLEKKLFGDGNRTTPAKVKDTLADYLEASGVDFVFGSLVTHILWDQDQQPGGVVMANRAGRQAIQSKVIIDATDRAWICRQAGAEVQPWNGGKLRFQRQVIKPTPDYQGEFAELKPEIDMPDLHFASFARAEQSARDKTYIEGQWRASEKLFHIPPDSIICQKEEMEWNDDTPDMGHFKPKGLERIYALNGCAAVPRPTMKKLLRPAALASIGELTGAAAAREAKKTSVAGNLTLRKSNVSPTIDGDSKELLTGLRPTDKDLPHIHSPSRAIPVLGEYDVVVAGGGTAGAASAIGAARQGKSVLVLEYQEGLGGTGTVGLVGKPYHGQKKGFAAEVPFPKKTIEPKMEWYRREIAKAGGKIWLGVISCGAFVKNSHVKGVVVATPENRGVVLGKVIIDATGNGDIAIAAGAGYRYGTVEKEQIALQGSGYPVRPLTGTYANTDYLLVDETDMVDVKRSITGVTSTMGPTRGNYGKYIRASLNRSKEPYDLAPFIQNRERRRIVGDYTMTYPEQVAGRTHADTIVHSKSDYDSHCYPTAHYFALLPHDKESLQANHPAPGGTAYTPYRCLLPRGLEGILVVGLSISMDRDATAMMRMQLDISNQGYAAGIAASMAVQSGETPRNINVKKLQQHLVDKGNLPPSILNQKDSFPLSDNTIRQAVYDFGKATDPVSAGKPLAIIQTHKDRALPFIREQYEKTSGRKQLLYARILGIWGYTETLPVLKNELQKHIEWDDKILQGRMADYAHLPTPLDAILLAMAYTGDHSVLPILLNWLEKLNAEVTLSHHRSLALALEKMGDPSAAKPLSDLLNKPGMKGHTMTKPEQTITQIKEGDKWRTRSLRESMLARALYHCGDYNGIGESILRQYTSDLRGLFARHAREVLEG